MRQWFGRQGIDANATLIAGVSGSLDSMVWPKPSAAWASIFTSHTNHLRGEASDADQALVEEWCAAHWRPLSCAQRPSGSNRARRASGSPKIRYAHFERLRADPATARAARPTSSRPTTTTMRQKPCCSTSCVLRCSPSPPCSVDAERGLLRPFLALTRAELAEASSDWNVAYREDASNAKPDYLRNRIRHEVLPLFDSLRPARRPTWPIGRTGFNRCSPSSRQNAMLPPHAAGK